MKPVKDVKKMKGLIIVTQVAGKAIDMTHLVWGKV